MLPINYCFSQTKIAKDPFKLNANYDVSKPYPRWKLISGTANIGNYDNYYKRPKKHYDLINKNSNNSTFVTAPNYTLNGQVKKDYANQSTYAPTSTNSCTSCSSMSFNYYYEYSQYNNFMPAPSIYIQKSGIGVGINCAGF